MHVMSLAKMCSFSVIDISALSLESLEMADLWSSSINHALEIKTHHQVHSLMKFFDVLFLHNLSSFFIWYLFSHSVVHLHKIKVKLQVKVDITFTFSPTICSNFSFPFISLTNLKFDYDFFFPFFSLMTCCWTSRKL